MPLQVVCLTRTQLHLYPFLALMGPLARGGTNYSFMDVVNWFRSSRLGRQEDPPFPSLPFAEGPSIGQVFVSMAAGFGAKIMILEDLLYANVLPVDPLRSCLFDNGIKLSKMNYSWVGDSFLFESWNVSFEVEWDFHLIISRISISMGCPRITYPTRLRVAGHLSLSP